MRKHHPKEESREVTVTRTPAATPLETLPPISRIEREMLTTLHDMERWFEDTLHRPFFGFHRLPLADMMERRGMNFVPTIDMYEDGNELVVKAELAGMKREDIKLELSGNMLTLSGEKRGEEKVERKDYYHMEHTYGRFSRSLELPEGVGGDDIKAHFTNGLLEIRIPLKTGNRTTVNVPIGE